MNKSFLFTFIFICIFFVSACNGPQGNSGIKLEMDTDRSGSDFDYIEVKDAQACAALCLENERCKAFTFVKNNNSCGLKSEVPPAKESGCCISGVK
jgi:hypothetical protein